MSDPVAGIDQSDAPYVIVVRHPRGLFVEDYREYLESSVHDEFDEWLVTRHQHRTMVEELNGEYVEQWEHDNEAGLRAPTTPACATRSSTPTASPARSSSPTATRSPAWRRRPSAPGCRPA